MKRQVVRISVFQSSRVISTVSFTVLFLLALPLGAYTLSQGEKDQAIALFVSPLIYSLGTFLSCIVLFFLYNQAAKIFGGIEFDLTGHSTDKTK